MKKLIEYVNKELKVNDHRIGIIRKDSRNLRLTDVDLVKYKEAITYADNYKDFKKRKFGSFFRALYELTTKIALDTHKDNKKHFKCMAGRKMLIIGEEGDLYPCELLSKSFGNIRDGHTKKNIGLL